MPLDPVIQMIVDNSPRTEGGIAAGGLEQARVGYDALKGVGGTAPALASVTDRTIDVDGVPPLPVRIYVPEGDGPFGAVVFFHGGGWTIGSLESHDPLAATLAAQVPAVVISVDYRLAPEHPFPAAADDAWAALRWVVDHAAELGVDGARVAVAGDSAGGNLSAVCAIRSRDEGGPRLAFQALVYPSVDARGGYPSLDENAEGPFLTKDTMEWFFGNYVPSGADLSDYRLSPILADLTGVAPALVITAEYDPLRDEGIAFAAALDKAGVPVSAHHYEGLPHVFVQLAGVVPQGQAAIGEVAGAIREAFAATSTATD